MMLPVVVTLATALLISLAVPLAAEETSQADFLKVVAARDLSAVESMLDRNPALASARSPSGTSAVTIALFAIAKGEESFHDAATNQMLQAILRQRPQLDLFDAAAVGTADQVNALLHDEPAGVNRRSSFGWTPLHMSAFAGNAATTELLIERGASIESRAESKFRNTPLQASLLSGQYATAKILLDRGADALVRQSKGFTPLHEAALLGRLDLVKLLLDHGAELSSVADNGQTPLAEAIRGHHDELAAWMKAKGAVVGVQPDEEVAKK